MDLSKIGNFIAKCRKDKGLTQKELADKLDLSEKTICKRERGGGFPDVNLILSLCKVLEIDVNELLTGEKLDNETYRKKSR
ncbi:MAG: helix-turn-helix transcriptional regulator [Candidatus Onthovivens sp.]|nr:helix-turn-helix domain-containing protein [Mollicutes bacterium]MDY4857403.1 helix-turn-helix transcriptional regulator [Candidatus Onthovivens sp.]MDY4936798.1 helix-turn-helix transcriptional regulator [Candidatus Onthovivens sp.]